MPCIHNYQQQNDLKKQLLVIKNLADNYPNSGSLNKALNNFDKDLGHKIKNNQLLVQCAVTCQIQTVIFSYMHIS
jgi:hypothetical protein